MCFLQFSTEHAQSELTLAPHMETINRCFDQPSVEGIVEALENEKTEWAKQQLKVSSKVEVRMCSTYSYIC